MRRLRAAFEAHVGDAGRFGAAVMLGVAALAGAAPLALPVASASDARAPREIVLPGERVFPESLTSLTDGTVIIGSLGARTIYRAAPGAARAEPWIPAGTPGVEGVAGVLADAKSRTLWACTAVVDLAQKVPPAASALLAFDLATGTLRSRYPLPAADSFCNDIAIGADGTVYATDSTHTNVLRLAPGAAGLEQWAGNGALGGADEILDGIAIVHGRVFVNAYRSGKLHAIDVARDGRAGRIVAIALDRPLESPDGMRPYGSGSLLVAESGGGGRLSRVAVRGDRGRVTTLAGGFADGPAAVTVVGRTAYVLESQFARLAEPPGAASPPKPFRATAVALPRR